MHHNQLALVSMRGPSNMIPNLMQGGERGPQTSGLAQYYRPEASKFVSPKQPPVKVRLPREADRSRLAKDILKQLGKPNGLVPAVPTRREYKERKKAEAKPDDAPIHLPAGSVAEPQPVLDREDAPSLPDSVPGQVAPSTLSKVQPQEGTLNEQPSSGKQDHHRGSVPPGANGIEQDVDMDIQSSSDPLVSRPSVPPRLTPPQDYVPSLTDPGSAQGKQGGSVVESPLPSEPQSSRWIGPPSDADVIEISDDEGQSVTGTAIATVEPMEVDGEIRTGDTVSKSLSQPPLDDDTPVAVELGKNHTEGPLGLRSPQEPVVSKDIQFTEKKSQKVQPYVEVPPLPGYVRMGKGKERAPVEAEDEEGLYGPCI